MFSDVNLRLIHHLNSVFNAAAAEEEEEEAERLVNVMMEPSSLSISLIIHAKNIVASGGFREGGAVAPIDLTNFA